jgi:hypothetical protein
MEKRSAQASLVRPGAKRPIRGNRAQSHAVTIERAVVAVTGAAVVGEVVVVAVAVATEGVVDEAVGVVAVVVATKLLQLR